MEMEGHKNHVAVVGMSCRFPGARDTAEFWRNLCGGVESVARFSDDELRRAGVPPALLADPAFVGAHGALADAYAFDAGFFGVSAREAQVMDPQHRVFLECAWSALEDAGVDPARFEGAVAVYAGSGFSPHLSRVLDDPEASALVPMDLAVHANDKDFLTTRVSYKLGLRGPSVAVQTACSTSLVAIHLACQSLLARECDVALAGGVTIWPDPVSGYRFQEGGIQSPDGRCRAFDARAAGTVAGSGAGVVALKRLDHALRDGDVIHAVVRGSAINNDGAGKVGFTAPSVEGQALVIAEALALADVDPSTVTYVETHGTGTPLGDPIEIAALKEVFDGCGAGTCALGAVKTNLGHLDTAAGVAGFIKAVLALKHRALPPTLHFQAPNPATGLDDSPFRVNAALCPWERGATPLRAGVSAFGIGGTNAHVVLEEAPGLAAPLPAGRADAVDGADPSDPADAARLVVLSARGEGALQRMRANLAAHLARHPELPLAHVAFTLQEARAAHRFRWAAAARDLQGARDALAATAHGAPRRAPDRPPPVAFLFPGQGTQYAGMARELYAREPLFRAEVDRCADALRDALGLDLREALFPAAGDEAEAGALLRETRVTQPALFVIEYALSRLWMSWGVRPAAMLGHSIGEYVAACLAGVFSLDAALRLVAARGRLMQALPAGAMLAVPLSEAEVRPLLAGRLSLAAVNSPAHCVVSGEEEEVARAESRFAGRGVETRRLHTSHAFHSAAMEPILAAFGDEVRRARPGAPSIPFLSNVTGDWITAAQASDPGYWVRHLRETVRFADGVARLLEDPDRVLLEVGPGETLGTFARRHAGAAGRVVARSLAPAGQPRPGDLSVLEAAGALWTAGVEMDWAALRGGAPARRVSLPTYPFERVVHQVRSTRSGALPEPSVESSPVAPVAAATDSTTRVPAVRTDAHPVAAPNPGAAPSPGPLHPLHPGHMPAATESTQGPARAARIADHLREMFARLLATEPAHLDASASFLELGADSLLLMQASRIVESTFGVRVPFRRLLEELSTVGALAAHLGAELPAGFALPGDAPPAAPRAEPAAPRTDAVPAIADLPAVAVPAVASAPAWGPRFEAASADAGVQALFAQQLAIIQRQLELLGGAGTLAPGNGGGVHPPLDGGNGHHPPANGSSGHGASIGGSNGYHASSNGSNGHDASFGGSNGHHASTNGSSEHHASTNGSSGHHAPIGGSSGHHASTGGSDGHHASTGESSGPRPVADGIDGHHASAGAGHRPTADGGTGSGHGPTADGHRAVAESSAPASHGPHRPVRQTMGQGGEFTERQARHFEALVDRYTARTRGSKAYAACSRPVLADNRASLNFRLATKELMYPVVGERSQGSRLWDVDGTEYVDFTIGFGVHFFGHRPPFVVEAVEAQLRRGFHTGPQSDLAGPTAALFREMTGMERVTFCNTGSEAVMTALRVARAVTGRDRVVLFEGAYHGCFDGILARPGSGPAGAAARPVAPGTPRGMVEDVVVLPYGTPGALEWLRANAGDLAAVLVEPVQSNQPELHPRAFLHEVREITARSGTALVFDEMITGLRLEPRGAQGFFGVEADLATYGKVIGGGFPLGVLAGRAHFMDAIDGGPWSYGDDSYPAADQTFFAGTFCKHPVTMAAAHAVLVHLRERGPALYEALHARAGRLVAALRAVLDEERVPIRILHSHSFFRFVFRPEDRYVDLLFYHMLERGIYIWEGRACFLSTAHTDEDCDRLVAALRDSIHALREGGFLPQAPGPEGGAHAVALGADLKLFPAPEGAASPDSPPARAAAADPAEAERVPLTPAQRQVWVHAQLGDDASRAYNEQFVVALRGRLDARALEAAVADLAAHHESLRTVFDASGDTQRVLPALPGPVPLVVHEPTSAADPDRLAAALDDAVREVFDLGAGPLFRVHLHADGPERGVLQLVVHHVAADGLAIGLLKRDLETAYLARREGRAPRLPAAMQFGEYAALLAAHAAAHADREAEWLARFRDAAPLLLPTDRPRPPVPTHRAGSAARTLPPPLVSRLRDLARRQGCTPFMVLLGGLLATLHRTTGQDDLVVGISSAGRPFAGSDAVVGHCVDVLPVRSRAPEPGSALQFLRDVRGWLLDAYEHEVFSYARLHEKLRVPRGPFLPPLISVTFNLEPGTTDGGARTFAGHEVVEVGGASVPFTKFDLTVDAVDAGSEIHVACLFNADLFDGGTVERLLERMERVLDQVASRPQARIAELDLLGPEERARVVVEWNRTQAEYPADRCIHQLFEAQAERTPGAVAVTFGERTLRYAELDARANRLARHLRRLGVGPEVRVGLCMERGPELMVSLLGVLKAGGAYVPVDPSHPGERIAYVLEDSAVRVLLTQARLRGTLSLRDDVRVVEVDEAWERIAAEPAGPVASGVTPQNLAYVIYTSGSTGRPKGVAMHHRGVCNYLHWGVRAYGAGQGNGAPVFSSMAVDLTITNLLPLFAGRPVHLLREEAPVEALAEVLRERPGFGLIKITPTHLALLTPLLTPDEARAAAGTLVIGADFLPAEATLFMQDHAPGVRLMNEYGPTETVVGCSAYLLPNGVHRSGPVPVGGPIQNLAFYVLDGRLEPVPVGVAGELYIGGVGVARGYLGRPALSAEKFVPDPFAGAGARMYRTGDRARWLAEGGLVILGRTDSQVKVRGHRVELGEIEAVLRRHEAVSSCLVVVREDVPGDRRLVAYVVTDAEPQSLRGHLGRSLPEYMIPGAFVRLDALPQTSTGKIDPRTLPAPDGDAYVRGSYQAPAGPVEPAVAEVWSEVLGVERVGRGDHFFELGGHSLAATQVIWRLRQRGLHADVRTLFTKPVLAELAAALGGESPDVEVPANGIAPGCRAITPEMLSLVALTQAEIDRVVATVPGGAANVQDVYPLAPLQEGILFHHLVEEDGDPYLLASLTRFHTRERLDAYLRGMEAVVARHDVLRTAVLWEGLPEPVQVVWRSVRLAVEEVELDAPQGEAEARLYERFHPRRFRMDVRQAPLMRIYVARDGDRWLLLMLLHHLASDHVTLDVLTREVHAHLRGEADRLPAAPPFRTFVAQARLGVSRGEHEAFFRGMLGDFDEPVAPFGLAEVRGDGSDVVEACLPVDGALAARLQGCARRLGVSAASLFHVAWAQVLACASGRDDVVFGTILLGRTNAGEGAESVVGPFINTLPVRLRVGDEAVEAGVRRMHALLAGLLRHEHAPLALVQRYSGVRAPSPLFCTLLNYRHETPDRVTAQDRPDWSGIEGIRGEERTNYPLTLSVDDLGDGFQLNAKARPPVAPERVCALAHAALAALVDALEASPRAALASLDVLPDAERRLVVEEWNATDAAEAAECVHHRFQGWAARTPDAPAVVYEGRALSYAELNARANRLAHFLAARGVGPDARVGLCMERGPEMAVALLAILKAGAAYLPLDPAYPADRLRHMVDDGAPAALLTHAAVDEVVGALARGTELPVIRWETDAAGWAELPSTDPAPAGLSPQSLCYVIYTSGSTGRPKGVMNQHGCVANRVAWGRRTWGVGTDGAVLGQTPLSFDGHVRELFLPWSAGARVVMARPGGQRDPDYLLDLVRRERITLLNLVPSLLQVLVEHPALEACDGLARVLCGGESLPGALAARVRERLPRAALHNLYGPSEAATALSLEWVPGPARATVPLGRPIDNVRAYLLDGAGRPVPVGAAGELYMGGAGVGRGYLGRPALTAERFVPDPFAARPGARLYRTGDLARWLADGTIEFLGRNDFQVKVRGFRVEPGEVEAALAGHPAVREAVVLARADAAGEMRLVAYCVAEGEVGAGALRAHLAERLPEHMIPAAYVRLDRLPLTPSGKLDRAALPEPEAGAFAARPWEPPLGGTERAVADVWAAVLGLDRVGRWDHFFELGGHSLRAVQVVSRVRQALGVEAALGDVFLRPVLADFARGLERAGRPELPPVTPVAREGRLPLSFAQRRLWFVERMASVGATYNVPLRLRLRGGLDRDALERALARIVARHEALRTVFAEGDDEPEQRVLAPEESGFRLWEHDLAGLPENEARAELARRMDDESAAPFDLERGPVIRAGLIRRAADDHVLLLTLHHIASDGWSMDVLLHELTLLYAAFARGEGDPLPPLPVQYADYAAWQRRWMEGEVLREQAAYWTRALAGAPELLELPTDRPRPAEQDFTGAWADFSLDAGTTAALAELARRHGTTLFTALLAGWAAVLGRLSGQGEVVVGTPAANRGRGEIEGLIGFFVNTLALRVDLSGAPTVAELLQRVRARSLEAQGNQDVPFEQVVELVRPARTLAHAPVFQAALAWQNTPGDGSLELCGLALEAVDATPRVAAKFDLSLSLREVEGRIVGGVTYATALFDAATVERWLGYLRNALEAFAADDGRRVDDLPLLPEAERRALVEERNRTDRPYPREVCLHERFQAHVAERPDAVALEWDGLRLTYAALDARANRLAHHLAGLGVGPESRVGILLERGPELVVAILATVKAGGCYVPLDPAYPAERLRWMLADAGVRVLVTRGGLAAAAGLAPTADSPRPADSAVPDATPIAGPASEPGAAGVRVVALDEAAEAIAAQSSGAPQRGTTAENLAYIVYTSGSTGRPKGVMVNHRTVVQLVVETDYVRLGPGDRIAQASNASFDALTFELWGAFLNGATLVGVGRDDLLSPPALKTFLREKGITTLYQTTALLNQLAREAPDLFAPLREVLFGGQQVDAESVRRILASGGPARLLHVYGPTETTAWCSCENVQQVAAGALTVSVGRPTGNQRIYLLDAALQPVPSGVSGEAYVGGGGVVRGYLDRPALTAQRFLPDPFSPEPGARMYRTGDRLRWTSDGTLEFVGRVDEQVKIRGFRIEPGEVESVLAAHPAVREARVVVREDEPGDPRLVAYVVGEADAGALETHLRRSLPEYMVPAAFVALDRLPLTPNGKVDAGALPRPERAAPADRHVAPRTPVEQVLAALWGEVLRVERVGVDDDFFRLGGHSLLIMRLLTRVRDGFGVELSIRDVFAAPTLAALAARIERGVYASILEMSDAEAEHLAHPPLTTGERR